MREILFKGKRVDNGEWVEGYVLEKFSLDGEPPFMVIDTCRKFENDGVGSLETYFVDPETVGQWTGLKDKNGTKIFEGDIIKITHESEESIHEVRWYGGKGYPAFDVHPEIDCDSNGLSYAMAVCTVEVIGNIHDKEDGNE